MSEVQGRCPACGGSSSLFLGDGGYVTCARLECPEPDAASNLLAGPPAQIRETRQKRRDEWMGVVRRIAAVSAVCWLIAIVATADWIGGNSGAAEGVLAFAGAGALLTWAAFSIWRGESV